MRDATLLLAVMAATAACGHDDMDMTDHAGALQAHLGAAESDMADHHARVDAAATLRDARVEEASHDARMVDHLGGMMHEMGDMAACMEDGSDDMSSMLADVGLLGAERARHATRAAEARSLAEARAEEARHHERMSALMAKLRDHMRSLMRDMDGMSCHHG